MSDETSKGGGARGEKRGGGSKATGGSHGAGETVCRNEAAERSDRQARLVAPAVVIVEPAKALRLLDYAEVWRFRELLYFLVWRDVTVRFKQTALGVAWIVIRPLLSVAIFAVVFGRLAKMPSDGAPYPVFAMIGIVPWTYFAAALAGASQSLVSNASLITKVYVPRVVLPIASVLSSLVEVVITLLLTVIVMSRFGLSPPWSAVWAVPLLFLLTSAFALGCGLWLGAMNVRYRDVGNAVPFLLQIWMYSTPVVYPMSLIPERWQWVAALNPVAGVVETLRGVLLSRPVNGLFVAEAFVVSAVVLASGLFFFRSVERSFADTV